MANLDATQRQVLIESLTGWLREKLGDEHNAVDFELVNGTQATFGADLTHPSLDQNGSATLTVRINGGAHDTQAFDDEEAA